MLSFKCSTKGRAAEIHGVDSTSFGMVMHAPATAYITYKSLKALFGPPNSEDDPYKCDASWDLTGEVDGVSIGNVHLYNYKNGPNYTGEGTLDEIDEFHFRGDTKEVVAAFLKFVSDAEKGK